MLVGFGNFFAIKPKNARRFSVGKNEKTSLSWFSGSQRALDGTLPNLGARFPQFIRLLGCLLKENNVGSLVFRRGSHLGRLPPTFSLTMAL